MHTLKLILCRSTFWFYYTTQSFWVWVYKHGTSWLSNICPLFFAKNAPNLLDCGGILVHSPLQITNRFSIRFRSGLWLGHSKTSIIFWWSHSFVDLMYALCCCRAERWSSSEAWRFCAIFNSNIIPSTWLRPQFQLKKNNPKVWCCHHHASLWVWCFFGDVQCCCFCQTHLLELWPKS